MTSELRYSDEARQELRQLDVAIARRIALKLKTYAASGMPLRFAHRLTGKMSRLYRFRVGDYRAIFRQEIDGRITILFIIRIKHRKEAYD